MGDLKPIFSYLKPYRRELAAAHYSVAGGMYL